MVKFTSASTIGNTSTVHESGSAFLGVGVSSSLVSRLQVFRSGSNASVLKVDGGSGTLFEVTDNLSGSLFSVNTIAGFPILEVFSNNRMIAGAYGSNALVVSASSVGIGIATPSAKLHIQGNVSGSQFTSSRRNAVGFSGTASYARRTLTASYALNASGGGGGSTLRTGSTYPITASKTSAIAGGTTNRFVKYTNASVVGQSFSPIFESGSAFIGVGPISTSLISRLQVYRSGSNASVLKVDGGSGTLFEVTDNLSGSLFSVNTIAGFPILEVFSNNRMVAGAYGTNALVVSASSVGIGIATPSAKLHIQGNISGSQFTSSRRNAVGFFGTSSYSRRALTASYVLGGAAGSSGTSGANGTSGSSGASGTSGTSGSSGASGTSGTSGSSGTSGTSGSSGATGTSGSSGTSGVGSPGSGGTSGTSSTPALSLAQTFVLTASVSQFQLTQSVANKDQILVILDGLVQSRVGTYTVSGSTLTLTENALSGSNVDIRYFGGGSSISSSFSRRALTASYLLPASNNTTKAIFGYGFTSAVVSVTNLVSITGVVATDTTGVGTARYSLAAAGYGVDKAIFGYGLTSGVVSMTNLVSNTGVVATDTTGVGTARRDLAAARYGSDKAIFGYGYSSIDVSIVNLVSNTGIVSNDTTGVGTARANLAAAGYGTDKAIFGYGYNNLSIVNLVSNTGVVSNDTTGVGTGRWGLTAAGYGTDKAIFGYGYNNSINLSMTNLVSNIGVVATDTTGVGTARRLLAAAGYGGDKAIFGYGNTGAVVSMTNLVSNTGVVATDTTGVGSARSAPSAAGYSTT